MISKQDLRTIAEERLKDAEALLAASRFDGAVYLGGYVVEIGLKVRICTTLGWQDFPQTSNEFRNYQTFKTHDLDVLLRLSGIETLVRNQYLNAWSTVGTWNPEARYAMVGRVSRTDAEDLVDAARVLLGVL